VLELRPRCGLPLAAALSPGDQGLKAMPKGLPT